MSDNALANVPEEQITALAGLSGASQFADDNLFNDMTRSAFLPRLSLCSGSSDLGKEAKVKIGNWALVRNKDDFYDFGDQVTVLPISYRFAAMKFVPGQTEAYYDPKSEDFKRIQAEAAVKGSRASYGPQYLLWIPELRELCTFFFGSQSARGEARRLYPFLKPQPKPAILKGKLISTPENKWHVPQVLPCAASVEYPSLEAIQGAVDTFNNPSASEKATDFDPAAIEAQGGEARAR